MIAGDLTLHKTDIKETMILDPDGVLIVRIAFFT
ncbi:hypothetical protein BC624_10537 [Flavobacterium granuli]|uniref:Uncharacterized protein n=1 Tax=Flavobacterium granuli TaxID=280093 RepID=A0A1M5NKB9_9FLAO|nr:hypothetical protein BC624_10537 [Flavobacterium granuli]SHG90026.1 hypothetical protein SAMN05443373_10537 [Flavobacterium granuli]